ncbi:unnamed protein product [Dicrocoelium dendriticum]|nr:unnamed protein product [Dicrocoelium dendriticum]
MTSSRWGRFTSMLSVRLLSLSNLTINEKFEGIFPQYTCSMLKARALLYWKVKLFSNCTKVAVHTMDKFPWYSLRIAVNGKKLPTWYRSLSEFEQMWLINVMLNANTHECRTAVTKWKKNYIKDYKFSETASVNKYFILVGPQNPSACKMLLRKEQFVDGNIVVKECLVQKTSKQREPEIGRLARYRLTLLETRPLQGRNPDYSLRFLSEVNRRKCNYNGHWR